MPETTEHCRGCNAPSENVFDDEWVAIVEFDSGDGDDENENTVMFCGWDCLNKFVRDKSEFL